MITVLLVEDDKVDALAIHRMLSRERRMTSTQLEFTLRHHVNLESSFQYLADNPADVVLLDLSLPDSNPAETLQRIQPYAINYPIILLTGLTDEGLASQAVQSGIQDYLIKDQVDGELLVRTIRYAIERHKFVQDLEQRLIAQQQAEKELRKVQYSLQKANQELESLLYIVSHDLKEPLRSIKSFSDILLQRYSRSLDDKGQDFLLRVMRGAERMKDLIDDILKLSRIRHTEAAQELIASHLIVEEVLERLEHTIRQTGATIVVQPDLPVLYVNKTWLTEAVYNLVTNALKFVNPGARPQIDISAYQPAEGEPGDTGLVVRDRGPGVEPEYSDVIFQLFRRAVGREIEGTGAGLAIVRHVAEKYKGSAWVQPRIGGGSEFIITFEKEDGE